MKTRLLLLTPVFAFALTALLFANHPARAADDTQDAAPAATPAPGDVSTDDLLTRPITPKNVPAPPTTPPPAGAPSTERRGDDLIIHAATGDTVVPGFLKNLASNQALPFNIELPGRGACVMKINAAGAVVDLTCQR